MKKFIVGEFMGLAMSLMFRCPEPNAAIKDLVVIGCFGLAAWGLL